MRHETETRCVRLERNLDERHGEIVGNVTFVGRNKEYANQGTWRHDRAIKRFMVVRLDDGTEQKVMGEVAYIEAYFEHDKSFTTFENVEEIVSGDRVVIEVGPRFSGREFIHTNRIFKVGIDYILKQAEVRDAERESNVGPGVYKTPDGRVYVVKANKDKTRNYAKRLVESAPRMTEAGEVVEFDFVYEAGAIFNLKPEYQMGVEEAKGLMVRYGRCIACGRHLKDAKSVEAGMGPVCRKYFKEA